MNIKRTSTLIKKETYRFFKVWVQTMLSPIIVACLYFAVFGHAVGSRVGLIKGVPYISFIIPGLILLQSCTNAFSNPSSSIIISKYNGTLSDILMPPFTSLEKTVGYTIGGILRGSMVGIVIWITAVLLFKTGFGERPIVLFLVIVMANGTFSFAGIFVGLVSKTFDQLQGVSNFILLPMAFLGGAFYSTQMLNSIASKLTFLNPFFYFTDLGKWAFSNTNDISPILSFSVAFGFMAIFFILVLVMFNRGSGLKI